MGTDKTKNENNLLNVFKVLRKLETLTKMNVETLLKKHGVLNATQTGVFIRRNFLLGNKNKVGYYRWNPEKEIPSDMGKVVSDVVYYYKHRDTNPQPVIETKPIESNPVQTSNRGKKSNGDVSGYQTIFELLKECKEFTKINITDLLKSSKVPYFAMAGKPIIEDFLEAGNVKGVYRWRDPNVEIPNVDNYLQRIKDYVANLPSNKQKAAGKYQAKNKHTAMIPAPEKQMDNHLEIVIKMLQKASPVEAETIINKNDMFDGKVKMELRRMYHDGSLNKNEPSDIVTTLLFPKPAETVIKTSVPTKPMDEFDLKIQLAVKHTILGHYQKEMESLRMDAKAKAQQYGIELTDEELLQPIILNDME